MMTAVTLFAVAFAIPATPVELTISQSQQSELKRRLSEETEKASAPTDQHKVLAAFVGKFEQQTEVRMGPGEPLKARASSVGRSIMGGRFVQVESASAPDEELKGERTLIYGYDPAAKVYTLCNFDTQSLVATTATGSYDAANKTFTFDGERPTATGKLPFRWVIKLQDKGVIEQKILVKADGTNYVEVVTVVHTPKGK